MTYFNNGVLRVRYRNIGFGIAGVLVTAFAILFVPSILEHPSQAEATDIVFGDLVRYEELHGEPHVVFELNERVYFDQLKRDYKGLLAQRSAGWIMTGAWYFIPATDDEPATVGVARCTGVLGEACGKETELFGQVNSPEIVTIEVLHDGEWLPHQIEEPGYAVRLDGRYEIPDAYRWLDSNGDIVHEQGYVEPLHPGRPQP